MPVSNPLLDNVLILCFYVFVPPGRGAPPEVSGRGAASREEATAQKAGAETGGGLGEVTAARLKALPELMRR